MTLKPNDINQILKGYIDAALWTEEERLTDDYKSEYGYEEDNDDEDDELERLIKVSANLNKKSFESFTREDIEPNSLIKAYTDIKKFLDLAGESVIEAIEENGLEQLGHDIWLTRNGHGAGFFDRSYDDDTEKRLTQAAKALKEVTLYINDNVKLSFDNEHIFEIKNSKEEIKNLVNMAHSAITRVKGKDYAPDVYEIQAWIDNYLNNDNDNDMKNLITQKLHEMVEEGHSEFQNYMFFNNLKTIKDAIDEILQMDPQAVDQLLSDGHNWATDHLATSADDIEEVYHFLNATLDSHEPDSYDGETEPGYEDEYGSVEDGISVMNEAEYKGKKVQLGKPTRGDVKKYKVFVKNKKGKVVKVNFGDKNMEIKRDNPKRRKSFRARHKCSQAKDRTTPKYWSCRMWSRKPVSKIVGENFGKQENLSIFVKESLNQDSMPQPQIAPKPQPKTAPNSPNKPYTKPVPTRVKPFLPEVAPGTKTDPKAGIKEGKFDFETYHKTLGDTLREIERYVISRGFDPIEFGPFDVEHVSYGSTRRISIPLSIDGMPKKNKYLQAQIYRMDSGNYELNMYVG